MGSIIKCRTARAPGEEGSVGVQRVDTLAPQQAVNTSLTLKFRMDVVGEYRYAKSVSPYLA